VINRPTNLTIKQLLGTDSPMSN